MEFVHMSTAYILRWNKPDYKEIIGVFHMQEYLHQFLLSHFSPEEIGDAYIANESLKIEMGRYYEPKYK